MAGGLLDEVAVGLVAEFGEIDKALQDGLSERRLALPGVWEISHEFHHFQENFRRFLLVFALLDARQQRFLERFLREARELVRRDALPVEPLSRQL